MMQIARFEASYSRIFGDQVGISEAGDAFFVRFYELFLASSPQVRELFAHTDMTRQVTMLRRSLFELVTFYVSGIVSEPLRAIAQVHQHLQLNPDMYDDWLDALVATAREFDRECDELTEYAWRLALMPGITYMKLWCGADANPFDGP
jgi:hemoglobin-like flavoprotein